MTKDKTQEELLLELENTRAKLVEAEETLRAIRSGEVDALVVSGEKGDQVFTLKGAEQPYRILIEEMSEGAVMLAADDSILYCNSGFASMLKTPLEKLMGTGITHYIAPDDEEAFRELLRKGKKGGTGGEITLLSGDGTPVPAHISLNTLQMDDARLVYMVATDLTEQKHRQEELQRARDDLEIRVEERTAQLAKSEQRWATTLASIGDAVISTDTEGRITFMNAEAESLTGWSLAEASTRPVTEIFNIVNEYTRQEVDNPVTRVLLEGGTVGLANHTILVRKDGTEVPIDDSGAPIRDGEGKTMGVVLVFRDITERKRAEELEKEARTYAENIVETVREPLLALDRNLRVISANPAFYTTFRVSQKETENQFIYDLGNRQWDIPRLQELLEDVIPNSNVVQDYEVDHTFLEIGHRTMLLNARRIYQEGIGTQMILLAIEDITERKRAEEALRESEARFRSVLDNSRDVIYRLNVQTGLYEYISPSAETVVGFSPEELMALDTETALSMIHPDDLPAMRAALARLEDTGKGELEYRQLAKNGEYRWISNNMYLIKDSAGRPLYRNGNIRDITQNKLSEKALRKAYDELELRVNDRTAQLKESLEEKEILLREIHHRVKNNMQVISGLLMLQEESSHDENVSGWIKESQNRIDSMALIHEKLYRSESLSKIDFREYVDDLASGLFESYGITESRIRLKVNVENIYMGIDIAIPSGLIINELVSNSLKHAFPADKNGEIEISLNTTGEDMIELIVQDNGVGIPESIDFTRTESLGLHIVNILVENQLHGEITMNKKKGTEFRIRFREMK